ncbi:MAG: flippase [Candidatus Omnitrophica bacterium]|nr:flippase [Candidatus Omnitrophota bacterium]MDD5662242.1 flippase [Candidatus Omnitrophota bacterium]
MIEKIAKNTAAIIVANIIEMLFNMLISISLARYFGQNGFGKLSFLFVFFFFITSNDNLLIKPILAREMSRDKANAPVIIGNGMIIRALFSLSTVLLLWVTIWLVKCPADIVQLAVFTSIGLFMASLAGSYESIFQVNLNVWYFKAANLICLLGTLFMLYAVIFLKGDLLQFYILSLIPGFIFLGLAKHHADKFIKPRFSIDLQVWRVLFKGSWPLLLTSIFIFIYHRIDQVLLLGIKGALEVGSYSVAVKFAELFNIVPVALTASMLPVLSLYFKTSRPDFDKMYRLGFKYLLLLIIPVAVWASLFSGEIVSFIYGKQFLSSGTALAILIWAEIFVFIGIVNNAILVASDKQALDPLFTGVSAAVNITMNLLLIPKYGFIGAALSSLIAYPVGPVMGFFIKTTRPYSSSMLYYSLKPLAASSLMFVFIYFTRNIFWLAFFVSPFIYVLILCLVKGINKEDMKLVRSIIYYPRIKWMKEPVSWQ